MKRLWRKLRWVLGLIFVTFFGLWFAVSLFFPRDAVRQRMGTSA